MLSILTQIPDGLLECEANNLGQFLTGPTLIHIQGRRESPLFVSVLLHGNETTGWEAMRRLLKNYADKTLPRSLSLFIGNVTAAAKGLRALDEQPDYNRVWDLGGSPEHRMMQRVIEQMKAKRPFASIDIHNNTGLNPHYVCINYLDNRFIHLASLFSRTLVYFIKPDQVQSIAFGKFCPAVTLECGKSGSEGSIEHALSYVDAVLHLDHFPEHKVPVHDYDVYHTVGIVKVAPEDSIGFGHSDADICFNGDIDHYNFCELPAGTILAHVRDDKRQLFVSGEQGQSIADEYFYNDGEYLKTCKEVIPSMLTLDTRVIRQDCLCYLMEKLSVNDVTGAGQLQ